jgi:bifunctional non-homologous end joining protein LigD
MAASAKKLLETYRKKRDFASTPEPSGDETQESGQRYVIQKHAATRLHYDFRLELGGVLKSWAVTKGPSLDPSEKRLAVQTEDHPLGYESFEGVIPEGYGAGTVMLWDEGTWEPQGDDPEKELADGQLKVILHGRRLKGGWALILMKNRSSKGRKNWLLVKERDEEAEDEGDVLEEFTSSVTTGRSLEKIAEPSGEGNLPPFVEPQLAKLEDQPPEGADWLHEIKYDGYRIQARKAGDRVELTTRNGKNWTARYPVIADAIRALGPGSLAIDGELVAVDDEGQSRFELLQNTGTGDPTLVYYAFDLLSLEGEDLTRKPLRQRKERLAEIVGDDRILRYSDHVEGEGEEVIARACSMRLEGIISKKADASYRSGRGSGWIKSKCIGNDEFVVGGFRSSDKKGRPFASLLVGEFVDGVLEYRGRVGTGFDESDLEDLAALMKPLRRDEAPFRDLPSDAKRDAVWVEPKLVAQVAYTEKTKAGLLRHPSFLGLREDKEPDEVTAPTGQEKKDGTVSGVRLTSPDRVLFDTQGITKRDLATYMAEMAEHILPFTKDRPISLVRCPAGRSDECFFQKHRGASVPDEIGETLIEEKDGEEKSYLLFGNAAALVAAAQIGALELHGWGSRTDRIERPDRLVIDLDPDEKLDFNDVRSAAREVREVLESAGLVSFPMLTGGKGIHVVAPLERRRGWNDVKAAARGLARKLSAAAPDRYVAEAAKAKRGGRIFLDWMRNQRGATAIVPYSPRARKGAPVATPIRWDELSGIASASRYSIATIRTRLGQLSDDPWREYHDVRQSITDGLLDFLTDG